MPSKKIAIKRAAVEEDILTRAIPILTSGAYGALTIRELCKQLGITTGLFYRHFKTKDDLLAFVGLRITREALAEVQPTLDGKSLQEQLLTLMLVFAHTTEIEGPESVHNYMNPTNPACGSAVWRNLFEEQVNTLFHAARADHYDAAEVARVAEFLFVVQQGFTIEWYIRRSDSAFDIMATAERIYRQAIEGLRLEEAPLITATDKAVNKI